MYIGRSRLVIYRVNKITLMLSYSNYLLTYIYIYNLHVPPFCLFDEPIHMVVQPQANYYTVFTRLEYIHL